MNPPARLNCIITSDRKKVVIYRKGPAKWTQLILWDLKSDQCQEGQWIHGSVYPQKSDISPDGKYIATSIAKYSIERTENNIYNSWTAISKPPFFSALFTLFEKEGQARGGYFEENNHFVYNGKRDQIESRGLVFNDKFKLSFKPYSNKFKIYGEFPLYDRRITKFGWITNVEFEGNHQKTITPQLKKKKINPNVSVLLERYTNNFKIESKYYISQNEKKSIIENAEWMEVDFKNRILLAKQGSIYCSRSIDDKTGEIEFNHVASFNESIPEEIKPPEEYYKW